MLTTVVMAHPQAAEAFIIRTTSGGSTYPSVPNPTLPTPTVINFDSLNGNIGTQTLVPASDSNGSANIATSGGPSVQVNGGVLTIGGSNGSNATGTATLTFGATPGLGYFGFQWLTPQSGSTVLFTSSTSAQQSFTAASLGLTGSSFVEFFASNPNEIISSVQFSDSNSTTGVAFQVDNVNYQRIPTPALLPGLIAVGAGLLRKRKAEVEGEV